MIAIVDGFGLPLPAVYAARRSRPAAGEGRSEPALAAEPKGRARIFPMLFRLYELSSGRPFREDGRLVEAIGNDPAIARARLMANRDAGLFEVRIDTPRPPE